MKNLKRSPYGLSFLIALLCLQGCADSVEVSQENIENIQGYCKLNGGIKKVRLKSYIDSTFVNYAFVTCKDDAEYTIKIGARTQ